MSFQHAFTPTALCSPARASLLTGLYPHNHTMADLTNTRIPSVTDLPEDVPSFGTLLSQAGYRTSYVGKWHCGRSKGPLDWGFDDYEPGEGWHEWWPEGIKLEDESAIRLGYDRSKPMAAPDRLAAMLSPARQPRRLSSEKSGRTRTWTSDEPAPALSKVYLPVYNLSPCASTQIIKSRSSKIAHRISMEGFMLRPPWSIRMAVVRGPWLRPILLGLHSCRPTAACGCRPPVRARRHRDERASFHCVGHPSIDSRNRK